MTHAPHDTGKLPLSAFLITRNEEARLGRTLAALAFADQVVVVDSGSTDRTREIAEAAGAEVHVRAFDGYGQQKAFAEGLCRHRWVLNVDADEVATPELAREIAAFLARPPAPALARIRILNVYPGDARPRPFANDYEVVRLYHRDVAGYRAHPLFDRVENRAGAEVVRLRAPLWHFPFTSWAHLVDKENRYSSFAAEAGRVRGRGGLLARLAVEFPVVFLKSWIWRRHAFGGWKGFAFSLSIAFARTMRIAKMLERAEAARARGKGATGEDAGRCREK